MPEPVKTYWLWYNFDAGLRNFPNKVDIYIHKYQKLKFIVIYC